MAKLNGVVLTAEAIEYNGVKYEKIDVTSKAGDILRVDDSEFSYVTEGAYYKVYSADYSDDPRIIDNDGDSFDGDDVEYTLFRKVDMSQTTTPQQYREVNRKALGGERIKIVNAVMSGTRYRRGDELIVITAGDDGDVRVQVDGFGSTFIYRREYVVLEPIAEQSDDIIEVGGVEYRKLPGAQPQAGGLILAISGKRDVTSGKIYEVTKIYSDGDPQFKDDAGDFNWMGNYVVVERIETADDLQRQVSELQSQLAEAESKLATQKAEEEKARDPRSAFAKGDKVRLISGGGVIPLYGYEDGEVYTVSNPQYHIGNKIEIIGGHSRTGYALPAQLVKLSEQEIAEMNRLKVGEYAKVVGGSTGRVGDIVTVAYDDKSGLPFKVRALDGEFIGWKHEKNVVRATDEEIAEVRRKLELSKLVKGTHVKLTVEEGKTPKHDWGNVKNGEVGVVTSVNGSSIRVDFPSQKYWHADSSELTILTEEEAQKETKQAEEVAKLAKIGRKVNVFKNGDIVEVTVGHGGIKKGDLGVVTDADGTLHPRVSARGEEWYCGVKLIAPVESVVNLATAN